MNETRELDLGITEHDCAELPCPWLIPLLILT